MTIRFPLKLYRISGTSMLPTYKPGDVLLGWLWFQPRPGQAVIVRTSDRMLVKRIKQIEDGQVWVEGDNPIESTDSRLLGPMLTSDITAMVIAKLSV